MNPPSALNMFMSDLLTSAGRSKSRSIEIVDDKAQPISGGSDHIPSTNKLRILRRRASTSDFDSRSATRNRPHSSETAEKEEDTLTRRMPKTKNALNSRLKVLTRWNSASDFEPGTTNWEKIEIISDRSSAPLVQPQRVRHNCTHQPDVQNSGPVELYRSER